MFIPKSHPRAISLMTREKIVRGVNLGLTSLSGLTAHGRGEAFDYLIGEKTQDFAKEAITAASSLFLLAKHTVISVNGNTCALCAKELVMLASILNAKLEVNLFHPSKIREKKIASYLKKCGAKEVLFPNTAKIPGIESNRRMINEKGQKIADTVFVPLEDGDRTEALIKMEKKVITIDLNPLSRTAQKADITIVDNITRALPQLIVNIKVLKKKHENELKKILEDFDNKKNLSLSILFIEKRLRSLAQT